MGLVGAKKPTPCVPWFVRKATGGPPEYKDWKWKAGAREYWKMSLGMVATILLEVREYGL